MRITTSAACTCSNRIGALVVDAQRIQLGQVFFDLRLVLLQRLAMSDDVDTAARDANRIAVVGGHG